MDCESISGLQNRCAEAGVNVLAVTGALRGGDANLDQVWKR